ncbi:class 1 fructose-bisphosphatase [Candidatus Uhrbacteria bacterium]|nr:class 1 fructose-bisphosphatase [Candidatus Uhrbacteria bacterium]
MRQPTLTQFLLAHPTDHLLQKDLALIMADIAAIGKYISREVNRAGVVDIRGAAGVQNVQGEHVQKLDAYANELCNAYLSETGHFAALASEEEEGIVPLHPKAEYVIAFDPLDGSSNIDVAVSIGTIFSVHRVRPDFPSSDERQFLQDGRSQVLAGYIVYGASTVLVFSAGDGVHEFTLDMTLGEFMLSRERMRIPETCRIYSVNEGNVPFMRVKDQSFIAALKKRGMQTRYIGSLVADVHRNLIKGGIFLYPAIDKKGSGSYEGKLRLLYEAQPLAFIVEQAGGAASDGAQPILDIIPDRIHERTALYIGNRDIIEEYKAISHLGSL